MMVRRKGMLHSRSACALKPYYRKRLLLEAEIERLLGTVKLKRGGDKLAALCSISVCYQVEI